MKDNVLRDYRLECLGRVSLGNKRFGRRWIAKHKDQVIKVSNTRKECILAIKGHRRGYDVYK